MNCAQGSRRVFVPRDDILNICFIEHKHYFFICLTVCLGNFINVAEIAKTTLCVSQIAISFLQGSVETLSLTSFVDKFIQDNVCQIL